MPQKLVYHWKHGWIPLTHEAALSKAHGSAEQARKLVPHDPPDAGTHLRIEQNAAAHPLGTRVRMKEGARDPKHAGTVIAHSDRGVIVKRDGGGEVTRQASDLSRATGDSARSPVEDARAFGAAARGGQRANVQDAQRAGRAERQARVAPVQDSLFGTAGEHQPSMFDAPAHTPAGRKAQAAPPRPVETLKDAELKAELTSPDAQRRVRARAEVTRREEAKAAGSPRRGRTSAGTTSDARLAAPVGSDRPGAGDGSDGSGARAAAALQAEHDRRQAAAAAERQARRSASLARGEAESRAAAERLGMTFPKPTVRSHTLIGEGATVERTPIRLTGNQSINLSTGQVTDNPPASNLRLPVGARVESEYGRGVVTANTDRSVSYRLDNGEELNVQKGTHGYDRIKLADPPATHVPGGPMLGSDVKVGDRIHGAAGTSSRVHRIERSGSGGQSFIIDNGGRHNVPKGQTVNVTTAAQMDAAAAERQARQRATYERPQAADHPHGLQPGEKVLATNVGTTGDIEARYLGRDVNGTPQIEYAHGGRIVRTSVAEDKIRPFNAHAGEDSGMLAGRGGDYNALAAMARTTPAQREKLGAAITQSNAEHVARYEAAYPVGTKVTTTVGNHDAEVVGHSSVGVKVKFADSGRTTFVGLDSLRPAEPAGGAPNAADARVSIEHSGDGTLLTIDRNDIDARNAAKGAGFKWSSNLRQWYLPRNWSESVRRQKIEQVKRQIGEGNVHVRDAGRGATTTAAEREAATRAAAAERATRMDARAERKATEADVRYGRARAIGDMIPMGQPILVGHHSERRHRNDLAKIDANMRKGAEAQGEAAAAAHAAENARRTAAGDDPLKRQRRIDKNEAEVRKIDRQLADHELGTKLQAADPAKYEKVRYAVPIASGDRLEQLRTSRAELADQIAHDKAQIEASGHKAINPANVEQGDLIQYRGGTHVVSKVNKTTISVPSGYSWDDKVPINQVTRHTKLADMSEASLKAAANLAKNNPKLRARLLRELERRGIKLA